MPDHSNPSGNTIDLQERLDLLQLAERTDIVLLEDSPYRLVSAGDQVPALKYLDRDQRVVQLGSYSKTIFPGARVGYVVADQQVRDGAGRTTLLADELAKIKSMVTVNTPSVTQAVIGGFLLAADGRLAEASKQAASHYARSMRDTLDALEARFPATDRSLTGVSWNEPRGGFFLTVQVPFAADEEALARSAERYGVIWTPMRYFYPDGGGENAMRLSVSSVTEAEIVEGIGRLAAFIDAEARGTDRPVRETTPTSAAAALAVAASSP